MPVKRRGIFRRRRFGVRRGFPRVPRSNIVVSHTVSTMSFTAGPIASVKQFSYNVVLPDVQAGRPICIKKVLIRAAMAGGTAAAASVILQGRMIGEPWTSASNIIGGASAKANATNLQMITISKPTTLHLGPRLPGNFEWMQQDTNNIFFEVVGWSLLATSANLAISVYYTYGNDNIVSVIS